MYLSICVSVYVGVVNDRGIVVLRGRYASLKPSIAPYAHKLPRPHQEDGVGVANARPGERLWQLHGCGHCGSFL